MWEFALEFSRTSIQDPGKFPRTLFKAVIIMSLVGLVIVCDLNKGVFECLDLSKVSDARETCELTMPFLKDIIARITTLIIGLI